MKDATCPKCRADVKWSPRYDKLWIDNKPCKTIDLQAIEGQDGEFMEAEITVYSCRVCDTILGAMSFDGGQVMYTFHKAFKNVDWDTHKNSKNF